MVRYSTQPLLEWAHSFAWWHYSGVWYSAKTQVILSSRLLTSDENDIFSQFWSFEEKVYLITWIWKWWKKLKIDDKYIFLNCFS